MSPLSTIYNNENFEAFFTLISLVKKAKEITINLPDKSFSHFFIMISNFSANYINSSNALYEIINTNFLPILL